MRIWSCETGSAVPSRVSLLILNSQADSSANSRDPFRFQQRRRPCILYRQPPTANRHRVSLELIRLHAIIAYRWLSLPRVRRRRANNPQGSSSNGSCLFRYHYEYTDQLLCASLFPHHTIGTVDMCTVRNGTIEGGGSECIQTVFKASTPLGGIVSKRLLAQRF